MDAAEGILGALGLDIRTHWVPVEIHWEAPGTTFGCCCGYTGDHCVPLGGIVEHWECVLGWGILWGPREGTGSRC